MTCSAIMVMFLLIELASHAIATNTSTRFKRTVATVTKDGITIVATGVDAGDRLEDVRIDGFAAEPINMSEVDKFWNASHLRTFRQNSMCMETLYLVSSASIKLESLRTNLCKCSSCAEGGPGDYCCCDREETWNCKYVKRSENSENWEGILNRTFPRLLSCAMSCPPCKPPDCTHDRQCKCARSDPTEIVVKVDAAMPVITSRVSMPVVRSVVVGMMCVLIISALVTAVRWKTWSDHRYMLAAHNKQQVDSDKTDHLVLITSNAEQLGA